MCCSGEVNSTILPHFVYQNHEIRLPHVLQLCWRGDRQNEAAKEVNCNTDLMRDLDNPTGKSVNKTVLQSYTKKSGTLFYPLMNYWMQVVPGSHVTLGKAVLCHWDRIGLLLWLCISHTEGKLNSKSSYTQKMLKPNVQKQRSDKIHTSLLLCIHWELSQQHS